MKPQLQRRLCGILDAEFACMGAAAGGRGWRQRRQRAADRKRGQSGHVANIERIQSKHRADTGRTKSGHRADIERTQIGHRAGMPRRTMLRSASSTRSVGTPAQRRYDRRYNVRYKTPAHRRCNMRYNGHYEARARLASALKARLMSALCPRYPRFMSDVCLVR